MAANTASFKLFFSFDYEADGAWPKEAVLSLIQEYQANGAYYNVDTQPLVSTFEGTDNTEDWIDIKNQTGCFFLPDWSSLGPEDAWDAADNVADGLFSWDAWPDGIQPMEGEEDTAYLNVIGAGRYMMAVSPWFYTNLPKFDKNWVWDSDNLWYDRWAEILVERPAFVEIISWNDFGEVSLNTEPPAFEMDIFAPTPSPPLTRSQVSLHRPSARLSCIGYRIELQLRLGHAT